MIRTLTFILLLTSCFKEPTLDTSSDEKLKESIQKIEKTLKNKELANFIMNVEQLEDPEIKKQSHGKNAEELDVIVSKNFKEFSIAYLKNTIDKLEKEEIESSKINEYFENLNVIKSSTPNKQSIDVAIEFENNTPYTFGGMELEGIVHPSGRKKSWAEKNIVKHFEAGIEPKEKVTFEYNIHKHFTYEKVIFPKEYDLKVRVISVWDHKRDTIYPSKFTEKKRREIQQAKNELAELLAETK